MVVDSIALLLPVTSRRRHDSNSNGTDYKLRDHDDGHVLMKQKQHSGPDHQETRSLPRIVGGVQPIPEVTLKDEQIRTLKNLIMSAVVHSDTTQMNTGQGSERQQLDDSGDCQSQLSGWAGDHDSQRPPLAAGQRRLPGQRTQTGAPGNQPASGSNQHGVQHAHAAGSSYYPVHADTKSVDPDPHGRVKMTPIRTLETTAVPRGEEAGHRSMPRQQHVHAIFGADEDDLEMQARIGRVVTALACVFHQSSALSCCEIDPAACGKTSETTASETVGRGVMGVSLIAEFDDLHLTIWVVLFPMGELQVLREERSATPLCWMWGRLAQAAIDLRADLAVLLGDDVSVEPQGWPTLVIQAFRQSQALTCLTLNDAADPGFPSFPVLRIQQHADIFDGQIVPSLFVNQDFDPYLAEVYRSVTGCLQHCPNVTVTNFQGGVNASHTNTTYAEPRYSPVRVPHDELLLLLEDSRWRVRKYFGAAALGADSAAVKAAMTVDILIPSYRVEWTALERILACRFTAQGYAADVQADVRKIIVVDNPAADTEDMALLWNHRSDQLRVRQNISNEGASMTRNRLLAESLAEYVIFLDDDVHPPRQGFLEAYVEAFANLPQERGFAGPTRLPKLPALFPCAVHLSDATYFWEAPTKHKRVPWAVTANVAFKNWPGLSPFNACFPKTGGGEDIQFCLDNCTSGLISVPEQAGVVHPWWKGGSHDLMRFYKWAYGDGQLMDMYPHLTYRTMASGTELFWALIFTMLCVILLIYATLGIGAACAAGRWLGSLAVVVKLTECGMDLLRNCVLKERRQMLGVTIPWTLRAAASLESSVIRFLSETGRIFITIQTHLPSALHFVGRRFDWFCNTIPEVRQQEVMRARLHMVVYVLAAGLWLFGDALGPWLMVATMALAVVVSSAGLTLLPRLAGL